MFFKALNTGDNEVLNGQQPTAQGCNYKLFPISLAKLKKHSSDMVSRVILS